MVRLTWETRLGIFLVLASVAIYTVKFLILGTPENTYYYIFNALGFLPINVLLVTLILNQLLTVRAKRDKLQKLNMVIGTFFSEVGTSLLVRLSDRDAGLNAIRCDLVVRDDWSEKEFDEVRACITDHTYQVTVDAGELGEIRSFLIQKRPFLLRLLENPVLLEHEHFTEVLRAVFHLADELERRDDLAHAPATDLAHLNNDVNRAYRLLIVQWLDYMAYLKENYPYLFSLAMRTNPFDERASPVVRE
ncbi:hypothetical protein E2N92_05170 [Methanofollis formosanus]|uniref:Uncharacterized protein n=1 Tax=Methanofollis formosanus TaxID=299308 RepID=A0A8G0ZZQ5_9EURY|nr:hypothetical protein [Methanofollis formosanus]QYZ78859.1 hypothetical protein E2N92_05170 [Methanofollis formosanus]